MSRNDAGLRPLLNTKKLWRLSLMGAGVVLLTIPNIARASDGFTKPTAEELSMTSLPGYPGAAAVILYQEQIDKNDLHEELHYERIKILTEEGKKYANVELRFATTQDYGDYIGNDKMVRDIQGRTIHPDGTIVPFTGKPYLKVIDKGKMGKLQEKVFTLPDVEVGSIIEYRYTTEYSDYGYEAPDWFLQGDLYIKSVHYQWYPTTRELVDSETGAAINTITWFPVLPEGAKLDRTEMPATGATGAKQQVYTLNAKDIPPAPDEEYMPPIKNFTYRVLFNFSEYRSSADFWKSEGKKWSKRVNSFADPNGDLTKATQEIIAGANTQDEKLHKIYAAVMAIENTSYTREHDKQENKAEGVGKVDKAADVLQLKRGSSNQITELFIGMARAAGMKAYAMLVPDRSIEIFTPQWLSFSQFDALIAIVNVDGKEVFFDPGERYCPYGHLAWQHSLLPAGLRQTDGGTDFGDTPTDGYSTNKTTRIANLTMAESGEVTGKVDLTFSGASALHWRQSSLTGDQESLHDGLRKKLERMLPEGMEVEVSSIQGLEDYEKPLAVSYSVKGTLGTMAGKRMVLPVDLFTSKDTATFSHEKRELPVYFDYPEIVMDAQRINFPKTWSIEAVPGNSKLNMTKLALYSIDVTQTPANYTTRRTYAFGDILVPKEQYPDLRGFYSQFEAKDKDSIVLKPVTSSASTVTPPSE